MVDVKNRSVSLQMSARGLAVRLFLTCWLVYVLHFATNIVREIYLGVAIGDHGSFRVDEYANLHLDIFETKEHGWHIDNTPGASMLGAIPYSLARLPIQYVSAYVTRSRTAAVETKPPEYDSPWPLARQFYAEAWRRGLDIKLGLAAFVMQAFCMAPISAFSVVLMFYLFRRLYQNQHTALWLSLLYAFATPVFFRTGTLNQNLLVGHFAFLSFLLLWNPWQSQLIASRTRFLLSGIAAGAAVLMDYSGAVLLSALMIYALLKRLQSASLSDTIYHLCFFLLGALGPLTILWFYQWQSFGHPFFPPQHYMPAINPWVQTGYQGYTFPQPALLWSLAFDYRYGLFVSCPLLLLAFFPLFMRRQSQTIPKLELWFAIACFAALWIFFSGSNYTRLQFNTGVRYLTAAIPFLFIPTSIVLISLSRSILRFVTVFSLVLSWCLAMHRDVERGNGILEPVFQIFTGGFELPALTTLSRMKAFADSLRFGASPLPLFAFTAVILYCIWKLPLNRKKTFAKSIQYNDAV